MNNVNFENLKCVWMSSGVVEYKLCDLNFDCDQCTFDKALWQRTKSSEAAALTREDRGIVAKLKDTIREDDRRNDVLLLPNQLMVRKLYKNTYFAGITTFLGQCLEPLNSVEINIEKGAIPSGTPAVHIKKGDRLWHLSFPFDIYVLADMSGKKENNSGRGWIGMFEAEEKDVEAAAITGRKYLAGAREQLENLAVQCSRDDAGVTMQDGGKMISSLYELLGCEKFNMFIIKITGTKK